MKKFYWNSYYKKKLSPNFGSKFSKFCYKLLKGYKGSVYDLGCGNGRDTKFFHSKKINCYGVDQALTAIKQNQRNEFKNKKLYINNDFTKLDFDKLNKNRYTIYSRFSLHSINLKEENRLFKKLIRSKKLDYIMIEARTIHDNLFGVGKKISKYEYFTDHYRRFIDPLIFKKKYQKKFKILFFKVDKNFAKFKNENPKVMRIILKVNG